MDKQAASAPISALMDAERRVFANGMVVTLLRNPAAPVVSLRGEIQLGAAHESTDQNGLAIFTGAAINRGTAQRTFQQIADETEAVGASVSAGAGMHTTGLGGRSLSEDLPLIVRLLGEMLREPAFPEQELDRLRGQFLMGLRENEQDTRVRASRALRSMLFPPSHPYSRISSGTAESVAALTRDDLVAFQQRMHPAATTLVVVGDIDPAATFALIEAELGGWQGIGIPPTLDLPPASVLHGAQRANVRLAGKVQSDVIWAVHGPTRLSEDYYAASVANMILGRIGLGGRLGEVIREQRGLAYAIGTSMESDRGAGPWGAIASVAAEDVEQTIDAIVGEIARFLADGPTAEELDDARSAMTGGLALSLETNDGIAATLLGIERYELGADFVARYPAIINALDHDAVLAAARHYLSDQDFAVAVAGP